MNAHTELVEQLEFDVVTALEALDNVVHSTPSKTAIVYGPSRREVTYREFQEETDSIGGLLAERGVHSGDPVIVLSRNPLLSVLAMYGIWKAGGVYTPLSPDFSQEMLEFYAADSRAVAVICDSEETLAAARKLRDSAESIGPILVEALASHQIRADEYALGASEHRRPAAIVSADSNAAIMYTSGTTGRPKGALLSHRWVNAYIWAYRRILTADDIVHSDLPLNHIGGAFFNVARALWVGGTVWLWDSFSVQEFWNRIELANASTALLLDVMISWLMGAETHARPNSLNKVHMQPLPANHREFSEKFGIDFATSGFGQTEAGSAMICLVHELDPGQGTPPELYRGLDHDELITIARRDGWPVIDGSTIERTGLMGLPGKFTEAQIHDPFGNPCPPNVPGELVIRPRVAGTIFSGYFNRAEETLQATRDLWFHTGDGIVYDGEEEVYYFAGRLGDRIRVKGENVSPYEVERVISEMEAVQKCGVVARPSPEGYEDEIVAFIEREVGFDLEEHEVLTYCRSRMPRYMIPRDVRFIEALPVTATTKIKRSKLREILKEARTDVAR